MSWNVTKKGTHEEAQQAIDADQHAPSAVKSSVRSMLGMFAPDKEVELSTNGHLDTTARSGNATITIKTT